LGSYYLDRLRVLEITPELVDKWSELAKRLLSVDFPARDFFKAAIKLDELQKSEGKPFPTLAMEYVRLKEGVDEPRVGGDSLIKNREKLIGSAKPLHSELESLERTKDKLENAVEIQADKLNELKSKAEETKKEGARLRRETEDLQRRKRRLSSEVGSREGLLRRLNDIGLSEEELLRVTTFIDRTSKNEGISGNQLKKRSFSALDLFQDVSGLENRRKAETQRLSELTRKEAVLSGEITELNKKKSVLEGEIVGVISSTSQEVKAVGEDAASQIRQHVADIKDPLNTLLADA
jgi:predicted  nucleic acid-binding Zn-ribbon protein